MTQALRGDHSDTSQLPADLPESTVSEIASWLVGQPLDAVERELIHHTLESCGGDRALTASVLGISLPNLRKKIRAYAVRGEALRESFEPAKEAPQAANDGAPAVKESAAEQLRGAAADTRAGAEASEPAIEPEPTLAVPEADNDPRLTLVETETAAEPVTVEPASEIAAAPVTPDIAPDTGAAVLAADPVAAEIEHAEAVETPKLIAGIATPRTKQKKDFTGPGVAATLALLVAAPIAYGLLTTQEKSKAIDIDRNRLEVTAIESPRFEQRIQAPVWAAPGARAAQAMPVDIAADRRVPQPAPAEAAAQTPPVPVAAVSEPAAAPAAPPATAEAVMASTPVQTVTDFNSEFGTEMALGPVDIAADVTMPLAPVNRLADLRMELAPADIVADTRMDAGPVNILADVRMDAGPVNILADVRMEFAEPEITGSVPAPTFFVAPQSAPSPLVRGNPDAPVRRAAPRPARAAPAQAEVPQQEAFPLIFPFSLFTPKNAQGAQGAQGTAAPIASGGLQPVDCCIQ